MITDRSGARRFAHGDDSDSVSLHTARLSPGTKMGNQIIVWTQQLCGHTANLMLENLDASIAPKNVLDFEENR